MVGRFGPKALPDETQKGEVPLRTPPFFVLNDRSIFLFALFVAQDAFPKNFSRFYLRFLSRRMRSLRISRRPSTPPASFIRSASSPGG